MTPPQPSPHPCQRVHLAISSREGGESGRTGQSPADGAGVLHRGCREAVRVLVLPRLSQDVLAVVLIVGT